MEKENNAEIKERTIEKNKMMTNKFLENKNSEANKKDIKTDENINKKTDVRKEERTKTERFSAHKKTEAVVNGRDLRVSTKHAVAVCNFIRNKNVDYSISQLEKVAKIKLAIPMKGEIPHRKGMMSGRYPKKTVSEFIKLLKSLRSNAINNNIELEKTKIFCMANMASRPHKRFGQGRHKRSHVQIKLIPLAK